jgi:pyridoxamine 5'-phosphate oxidase
MNKAEIIAFLKANPTAWLATVEGSEPRVRAMGIPKITEDEILIQTWKSKDVGKQMAKNPNVELCFNDLKGGVQVRVRGKVKLVEDQAVINQLIADRPFLKKIIESGKELALYSLKKGKAYSWTMAANFEPKTFVEL